VTRKLYQTVFDARIVALMKDNGVDETVTVDRYVHRFSRIRVTHPFSGPGE
jgi:predicted nucleic acid-binding protein